MRSTSATILRMNPARSRFISGACPRSGRAPLTSGRDSMLRSAAMGRWSLPWPRRATLTLEPGRAGCDPRRVNTDPDPRAALIHAAFADRARLTDAATRDAVLDAVAALDRGALRVAEKLAGAWVVHAWVKEAILLYFTLRPSEPIEAGALGFYDKVPTKRDLASLGIRVVPPGVARYGSFLEPGAILMPGFVNIGARVGAGTMVDTWATVGSCAQVGKNVHLSGGVGLGGVLEPPAARPVIIED